MYRFLVACLCVGALVLGVRADDEKDKKADKKPAEAYKAIMTEAIKQFRAAENADEKQKILKETSVKLIDLAEKNSKDPVAVQALVSIVGMPFNDKSKDNPRSKAIALLKKNHVNGTFAPRMLDQLGMMGNEEILGFVKLVADQNKDKKTRGDAVKAVLNATEQLLGTTEDATKVEALTKDMEKYRKLAATEFKGQIKDLFVGAKMQDLTSKNLEDKEVKLSDYQGKVVVLDIWATWCGPCIAMIPHSRKMVERLKDKPFALVSISFDAKKDTLTKFMEKNEMPWVHWWNGQDGPIGKELDIQFFPTIYVLDAKGIIRYKNIRDKKLEAAVEKLVKEAEAEKKSKTE